MGFLLSILKRFLTKDTILWLLRLGEESLDTELKADIAAYEKRAKDVERAANERAAYLAELESDNAVREARIIGEQKRRLELDTKLSNEVAQADALEKRLHEVLAETKPATDVPAVERDL